MQALSLAAARWEAMGRRPGEEISEVLAFWFEASSMNDLYDNRWFVAAGSLAQAALDAEVRQRFGGLVARAEAGDLAPWTTSARGLLALIIILDQFSRLVHRSEHARIKSNDIAALRCTYTLLANGLEAALDTVQLVFALMPYEHSPTEDRLQTLLDVTSYKRVVACERGGRLLHRFRHHNEARLRQLEATRIACGDPNNFPDKDDPEHARDLGRASDDMLRAGLEPPPPPPPPRGRRKVCFKDSEEPLMLRMSSEHSSSSSLASVSIREEPRMPRASSEPLMLHRVSSEHSSSSSLASVIMDSDAPRTLRAGGPASSPSLVTACFKLPDAPLMPPSLFPGVPKTSPRSRGMQAAMCKRRAETPRFYYVHRNNGIYRVESGDEHLHDELRAPAQISARANPEGVSGTVAKTAAKPKVITKAVAMTAAVAEVEAAMAEVATVESQFQRPSIPQPGAVAPPATLRPEGPCERRHGCEHWLSLCGGAEARRRQPTLYAQLCAAPPPAAEIVAQIERDLARTELCGTMLGEVRVGQPMERGEIDLVQSFEDESTVHGEVDLVQRFEVESVGTLPERRDALRRVLLAFARHDSLTGYVQGMGDIAAQGLLSAYELGEAAEEAAFWWLVHATGTILGGFFAEGMAAMWVELRVLSHTLHDMRPQLARHLDAVGCNLASLAPSWYLTLFQRVLHPSESSAALSQLAAGVITTTHLALGILLASEAQILAAHDLEGVTRELGGMGCGVSRTVGPGVLRAAALVRERWPDNTARIAERVLAELKASF